MKHTEQLLSKVSMDNLAMLVLDCQGKFVLVLKIVKGDIYELKANFNAIASELNISKMVTDNLSKCTRNLLKYIKML